MIWTGTASVASRMAPRIWSAESRSRFPRRRSSTWTIEPERRAPHPDADEPRGRASGSATAGAAPSGCRRRWRCTGATAVRSTRCSSQDHAAGPARPGRQHRVVIPLAARAPATTRARRRRQPAAAMPVLPDAPHRPHAVAPADLLAFLVGAARVRDPDLVDPAARDRRELRRHLRLEAEAILLERRWLWMISRRKTL